MSFRLYSTTRTRTSQQEQGHIIFDIKSEGQHRIRRYKILSKSSAPRLKYVGPIFRKYFGPRGPSQCWVQELPIRQLTRNAKLVEKQMLWRRNKWQGPFWEKSITYQTNPRWFAHNRFKSYSYVETWDLAFNSCIPPSAKAPRPNIEILITPSTRIKHKYQLQSLRHTRIQRGHIGQVLIGPQQATVGSGC